jgi:hypothetical protein
MCHHVRLAIATVTAIVFTAFAAQTAAGYSATFRPGGAIATTTSAALTFSDPTAVLNVQCLVELTGEFLNGPIGLLPPARITYIDSVDVTSCSGGSVTMSATGLDVEGSLLGVPDNMSQLPVVLDASYEVTYAVFGLRFRCRYTGDVILDMALTDTGTNSYTTGALRSRGNAVPFLSGSSGGCLASTKFNGSFGAPSPAQTMIVS